MFYVYFLKSLKNNKIYVGKTEKDPKIRLTEHNQHSNQWSKDNGPFRLIYYESYHCFKDAGHRELFYKSGFGKQIKQVIIETLESKGIGTTQLEPKTEISK